MTKDYPGEKWKRVEFDFDFTNDYVIEVSNFGRLRTFNKISDGNIVNGSMINGYRIIRLKLYKPRDKKKQAGFDFLQKQVSILSKKIKAQKQADSNDPSLKESMELLASLKKNLSKKFKSDMRERTVNYHSLIHRLVATYFLPTPKTDQTIVAHLDHNKLNNRVTNLRWMTPEENYEHQTKSPNVIKERKERKLKRKESSRATKLTVTKVMLLKKLLNEGKPMKKLVKQFKVTDTQIYRIKRGENWADVQAAE